MKLNRKKLLLLGIPWFIIGCITMACGWNSMGSHFLIYVGAIAVAIYRVTED